MSCKINKRTHGKKDRLFAKENSIRKFPILTTWANFAVCIKFRPKPFKPLAYKINFFNLLLLNFFSVLTWNVLSVRLIFFCQNSRNFDLTNRV